MEVPIIEILASLGVGGAIAIVVFFFYRRDRKDAENRFTVHIEQLRQDRVFMEDRMNNIIDRDQDTREANTKVITELTTTLQRMNGRNK